MLLSSSKARSASVLPATVPPQVGTSIDTTLDKILELVKVSQGNGKVNEHVSKPAKFIVHTNHALKGVVMQAGEKVTPAVVLKAFVSARDIDTQAVKAATRAPVSSDEWFQYFKFYLCHMSGELHDVMLSRVMSGLYADTTSFWHDVFMKMFPPHLVREALNTAISTYMPWDEPLGMDKWEAIVRNMLQYKACILHKYQGDAELLVSEEMYQQCHRLINACADQPAINLMHEWSTMSKPIERLLRAGMPVHAQMYSTAVGDFIELVKESLQRLTHTTVFGHSLAGKAKLIPAVHNISVPNSVESVVDDMSPPTMAQVVREGGRGMLGASLRHVTAEQKREFSQQQGCGPNRRQQQIAPTRKVRTWTA